AAHDGNDQDADNHNFHEPVDVGADVSQVEMDAAEVDRDPFRGPEINVFRKAHVTRVGRRNLDRALLRLGSFFRSSGGPKRFIIEIVDGEQGQAAAEQADQGGQRQVADIPHVDPDGPENPEHDAYQERKNQDDVEPLPYPADPVPQTA